MSEIKNLYVIEWMGPYDSLDDMYQRVGVEDCRLYIITGKLPYDRLPGIKYVGITKRFVYKRLKDKDHQLKQQDIKDKQYWAGRFSVSSYNNPKISSNKSKAELVEYLLVRYLSNIPGTKMINEKKTYTDPQKPVVVISRGQRKFSDEERYNKPSVLSKLPDVLMYVDNKFYVSEKLKYVLDTSE